jgi:hypothetical protein
MPKHHTTKAYRNNGGKALHIPFLMSTWCYTSTTTFLQCMMLYVGMTLLLPIITVMTIKPSSLGDHLKAWKNSMIHKRPTISSW